MWLFLMGFPHLWFIESGSCSSLSTEAAVVRQRHLSKYWKSPRVCLLRWALASWVHIYDDIHAESRTGHTRGIILNHGTPTKCTCTCQMCPKMHKGSTTRKNRFHSFADHCSQAGPVSCEQAPSGNTFIVLAHSNTFTLNFCWRVGVWKLRYLGHVN